MYAFTGLLHERIRPHHSPPLKQACFLPLTIALGYFIGGFLTLLPCLFISSVQSDFDRSEDHDSCPISLQLE